MTMIMAFSYGFSRAGSAALAFVLAENPSMTYEEAMHHVTARRPVLPHIELKTTIYQIYPRTGRPLPICPNVRLVVTHDVLSVCRLYVMMHSTLAKSSLVLAWQSIDEGFYVRTC